jgi:hypothetical protein
MSKAGEVLNLLEAEDTRFTASVKLAWDKTLKKTCDAKEECQAWIDKMSKKYPGDQIVAAWINPASVGAGDKVKVPKTGPIKMGDTVKVVFGSGIDSDKVGKVVGFQQSRLGKEAVIKQDDGTTLTMYVNRLFHPPKS